MISPVLRARLGPLARRQWRLELWSRLAVCWLLCAATGLALLTLQELAGWSSSLTLPLVTAAGVVAGLVTLVRHARRPHDWRGLARRIEARHPELDGVLLTAVQQEPDPQRGLGFLQERVLFQALQHSGQARWSAVVPRGRVLLMQAGQWLALAGFAFILWTLRPTGETKFALVRVESGVTVTPGDTSLERGSSLVVMARFGQAPASGADLVLAGAAGELLQRLPLVKNLDDPVFGASVPGVMSNLVYRVEFGHERTRDFKVTVFEYPRLERADVTVRFPEFTEQPPQRIENTRRVSAVEGSQLDLAFQFNQPLAAARLLGRDTNRTVISLVVATNHPSGTLTAFPLSVSRTYDLQLVDGAGRTNKVPAQFVFNALSNRTPELRLTSPRGDARPSPLEELVFEGTVWDDFGVVRYGLAYTVAGGETQDVELGTQVPGREKRTFRRVLPLEELGLRTDDLMSWYVWADDRGPDGALRRTVTDLFFGEIRPFDEIFREGQGMAGGEQSGQSGEQSGQQGSPSTRLAELQKQIINATWRLIRDTGATPPARSNDKAAPPGGTSFLRLPAAPEVAAATPSTVRPIKAKPRSPSAPVRPIVFGQAAPPESAAQPAAPRGGRPRDSRPARPAQSAGGDFVEDAGVVHDSQAEALDQAESARDESQDPRTGALWEAAVQEMEKALARLKESPQSPAALRDALAAEQAAYQALLKLQEREYSVSRNRNRQQSGNQGGRQQQMQRQLDQLELTQSENRYETQSQARTPQSAERREQLQVLNRLQELARRQQDLNERLQELQTALQAARTEQEREEIRRELKRLQEEQQAMIADVDELQQRMDRPENQSRLADQRRELEQARQDMQRSAEAAREGALSQALASGTRAQRQMQEMRDQLRRDSAGEFAEDLRQMRSEARELTRQQEAIQREVDSLAGNDRKTLSDADRREDLLRQLDAQKARLTNLVSRATQVSEQAEQTEPLVSSELYDALRKFSQNDAGAVKDLQEDLLNRGMLTQRLLNRLQETARNDGAKSLELTAEMLRQGYLSQADKTEQRARAGIGELTRGVERAADRVLGDDAEALRLAREQLDELTRQVEREAAEAERRTAAEAQSSRPPPADGQASRSTGDPPGTESGEEQAQSGTPNPNEQPGEQQTARPGEQSPRTPGAGEQASSPTGERQATDPNRERSGERTAAASDRTRERAAQSPTGDDASGQRGQRQPGGTERQAGARGEPRQDSTDGQRSGAQRSLLDQFFDGLGGGYTGPITGEDFAPWADRLREVEEMVDEPALRTEIARARERARQLRQDFRRRQERPDWAVVRLEVVRPLVEVRDRITEELARRDPGDRLVPIDRDPVPGRYSELVRRYYEQLGKDR